MDYLRQPDLQTVLCLCPSEDAMAYFNIIFFFFNYIEICHSIIFILSHLMRKYFTTVILNLVAFNPHCWLYPDNVTPRPFSQVQSRLTLLQQYDCNSSLSEKLVILQLSHTHAEKSENTYSECYYRVFSLISQFLKGHFYISCSKCSCNYHLFWHIAGIWWARYFYTYSTLQKLHWNSSVFPQKWKY